MLAEYQHNITTSGNPIAGSHNMANSTQRVNMEHESTTQSSDSVDGTASTPVRVYRRPKENLSIIESQPGVFTIVTASKTSPTTTVTNSNKTVSTNITSTVTPTINNSSASSSKREPKQTETTKKQKLNQEGNEHWQSNIHPSIPLSNSFSPLEQEMDQEHTYEPMDDNNKQSTTPDNTTKRIRMPPIVVKKLPDGNFFEQNRTIQSRLSQPIKISYTSDGIKYYTSCRADYDKLYNILQNEKLQFYSHEPRENKLLQVVLKRLPASVESAVVKEELEKLGYAIEHVRQMTMPYHTPDGSTQRRPIPIWVITLPNTEFSRTIYQLHDINNHLVTIEAYRPTPHVTQCHKCQGFGHTSKRCNLQTHCVKCGNDHLFVDCPSKGIQYPAKCANCQGTHTASYGQCPIQQEQRDLLRQKLRNKQTINSTANKHLPIPTQDDFPTLRQPRPRNLSAFENTFGSSSAHSQPVPESLADSLKDIIALLRGINIKGIIRTINIIIQRLKTTPDPLSKIMVLLDGFTLFTNMNSTVDGP